MRGSLALLAAHLGAEERAVYRAARDPADDRVRQVKRGTYETELPAGAGLPSRGGSQRASLPSVAPEPDLGPVTHYHFSLVLDVTVAVEGLRRLGLSPSDVAANCLDRIELDLLDLPDVVEVGRRHTSFLPRRGRPPVPDEPGDEQEEQ